MKFASKKVGGYLFVATQSKLGDNDPQLKTLLGPDCSNIQEGMWGNCSEASIQNLIDNGWTQSETNEPGSAKANLDYHVQRGTLKRVSKLYKAGF